MIKSEGLVLTMSGREPRFSGEVSERSHKNMSHIKGKDTSIEIILRKALWSRGYRYRKNYKNLPGRPDLAITKYKIAIFCDSEFFHGKDWDLLKAKLEKGKTQTTGYLRYSVTWKETEKRMQLYEEPVGLYYTFGEKILLMMSIHV